MHTAKRIGRKKNDVGETIEAHREHDFDIKSGSFGVNCKAKGITYRASRVYRSEVEACSHDCSRKAENLCDESVVTCEVKNRDVSIVTKETTNFDLSNASFRRHTEKHVVGT